MRLFYMLSLFLLVNGQQASGRSKRALLKTVFEGFGYTPACVAGSLAACERSAEKSDCSSHVLHLVPELKELVKKEVSESYGKNTEVDISTVVKKIDSVDFEGNFQHITKSLVELQKQQTTADNRCLTELQLLRNEINSVDNNYIQIKKDLLEAIKNEGLKISSDDHPIQKQIALLHLKIAPTQQNIEVIKQELKELKDESSRHFQELKHNISDVFDGIFESGGNFLNEIKSLLKEFPQTISIGLDTLENQIEQLRNTIEKLPTPNGTASTKGSLHDSPDGDGWIVIQNRDFSVAREKFNRPWGDYVKGFGDKKGEFWLGLDNVHTLVAFTPMELRVELEDFDGVKRWASYDSFKIGGASTEYVLSLGKYSGNAGDSLLDHNGIKFSAFNIDNDNSVINCAKMFKGAWWHNSCGTSNLNGYQHIGSYSPNGYSEGIKWDGFRGPYYSLKKTSMKIRSIK